MVYTTYKNGDDWGMVYYDCFTMVLPTLDTYTLWSIHITMENHHAING